MPWFESTLYGSALVFGFRHGFDWDHLAALTDLTGSQPTARRSMLLATLYAVGHAAMVLLLGVLAIVFAAEVPSSLDASMERFVGASLVVLGLWVAWTTVRTRGAMPPRSRWMLLIDLGRRAVAHLRRAPIVVIEHSHPHDHERGLHAHDHEADSVVGPAGEAGPGSAAPVAVATAHAHRHRHVLRAPADPFMAYGTWSSFGIGLLHGVGAETPTQVMVFAAAANAADSGSSLGVLACFVVGLLAANTLVAVGSTAGARWFGRSRVALALVGVATAGCSLVLGGLLLLGQGDLLPPVLAP